ncbi:hypothetical protein BDV93DRAFT_558059 [Ceratobasidium sp. AG-I]|nr:hypothetical protein BDV93DRAFT_558059 [Ceratobasidium sp. AG-I]
MVKARAKPIVQGRRTSSSRKKTPNLPGDAGVDQEAAQCNYIPSYMAGEAREALLVKMNTPEKSVDEGYIYVCEVTAKETEKNVPADHIATRSEQHMYVKVGCTKRPARRAKDWQKKCSANNFEPHGIWPKYEGTLSGMEYGDPFLYKYLPERLIKHELQYLAQSSAHLPEGERPVAPAQEICSCKEPGVVHTEIYAIARYGAGDGSENNKKLWDFIDEIVQRWTRFAVRYHKMPQRLSAAS